jgi:hypothetical protein
MGKFVGVSWLEPIKMLCLAVFQHLFQNGHDVFSGVNSLASPRMGDIVRLFFEVSGAWPFNIPPTPTISVPCQVPQSDPMLGLSR